MTDRIGFIGLGDMGGPIAHRIVDAGFPVTVWARRPEVLEAYTVKGASAAATVAELGAVCDHVGLCVVADKDIHEICDQLVPAMKGGSRIAIHSTISPQSCAELQHRCAAAGIDLIDAPVSGGAPRARAGTLTVMCGGTDAAFQACLPVLRTFGQLIVRVGDIGAGQHAKIINNSLLAANQSLAYDALRAGMTLGLDRDALTDVIRNSSGQSKGLEVAAMFDTPRDFGRDAALLIKDVGLLLSILPDDRGARAIAAAGKPYLDEAIQGEGGKRRS